MRVRLRVLGLDLLDLTTGTDCADEPADDDHARDLSGGSLGSERIEAWVGDDLPLGFRRGFDDE